MKATAVCHGAASIITGFATGMGGAFGIGLTNKTTIELDVSGGFDSTVNGESGVGVELAEAAVKRVLARYGVEYSGARVNTETDIPPAAGLKSSSVAANAIVLATIGALASECGGLWGRRLGKNRSRDIIFDGRRISDEEVINLGIDAAYDANVTVTGALDDASAAYFGGYTLTDNLKRRIICRGDMEETLTVLIHLPDRKIYSGDIKTEQVKVFAKEVEQVWGMAKAGRIYQAITLNGLIHSTAFKLNPEPAVKALEAGAVAAGLSGTGPATVALTRDGGKAVRDAWSNLEGRVIQTTINNKKAEILP